MQKKEAEIMYKKEDTEFEFDQLKIAVQAKARKLEAEERKLTAQEV